MNSNLSDSGFGILNAVLSQTDCDRIAGEISQVVTDQSNGVIAGQSMKVVGGRNLQSLWKGWRRVVEVASVTDLLRANLGDQFGLVRILFFDKPPIDFEPRGNSIRTNELRLHSPNALLESSHGEVVLIGKFSERGITALSHVDDQRDAFFCKPRAEFGNRPAIQ